MGMGTERWLGKIWVVIGDMSNGLEMLVVMDLSRGVENVGWEWEVGGW